MTESPLPKPLSSALFTDLYELTMAQAYLGEGLVDTAVFELFFRKMPDRRNFIVAAGLDDVLTYLENVRFTDDDLTYLATQEQFGSDFLDKLRDFRFTGDVYAMPEGTPVFPDEPLIQIVAPIVEAQIIETLVLNQIHFQSIAATKAARVVHAARGRKVVDFGSRRAHGADAAVKVARTCYLAGAAGTSNVVAGKMYDVPIFGTMAHSYIQAHDDEAAAFEAFAKLYPGTTLLVDTYDTLDGVRTVIDLCRRLDRDTRPNAVRLDSGDLTDLARQTRRHLDDAGLSDIKIFASNGLDEYAIADLLSAGAPIDGFGVGTKLAVSPDAPSLDMAYKLVAYADQPRTKLSSDKVIYPGRKQIFRIVGDGRMARDVIARHDETLDGHPLLRPVMKASRRLPDAHVTLDQAREHALASLAQLPPVLKSLEPAAQPYPVHISDGLQKELTRLQKQMTAARE